MSVLNLMGVGQGDEGQYMCQAVNRVEVTVIGAMEATVELIVLGKEGEREGGRGKDGGRKGGKEGKEEGTEGSICAGQ